MGIREWGSPLIMRQSLSYSPIPISGPNPQSPFLYNLRQNFFKLKKNFFEKKWIYLKKEGGIMGGDCKNEIYNTHCISYKKIIRGSR